jgi:serine phosphatase RsbU (regulator of sigma subunit)
MEQVLRESQTMSVAELLVKLLAEVRNWQPASTDQQDDITLLAIDVA